MQDHIKITQAGGTWVVRAGGAVIGESANALALAEGSYPAVIYFPRDDLGMTFLDPSDHTTHCPHKGDASYFNIHAADGELKNAAWSYEEPFDGVQAIAGHIAFYESDAVVVEQL